MLLALDIGNTNIHLGLFSGAGDHAKLVRDWRIRATEMTDDELALALRGLLGPDLDTVTGIVGLSTVPALLRSLRSMTAKYFPQAQTVLLEPGVRTGVPLLVDNPREVGADRVANALAAHKRYPDTACVVVDFGTATLVDAVSPSGQFLGGAIAPGIDIAVDALAKRTVTLRYIELRNPRTAIGKNTADAVQSGIIYGFAGQVDELVRRVSAELGAPRITVVATGYLAPLLLEHCTEITVHHPHLTLEGLRWAYETGGPSARRRR